MEASAKCSLLRESRSEGSALCRDGNLYQAQFSGFLDIKTLPGREYKDQLCLSHTSTIVQSNQRLRPHLRQGLSDAELENACDWAQLTRKPSAIFPGHFACVVKVFIALSWTQTFWTPNILGPTSSGTHTLFA